MKLLRKGKVGNNMDLKEASELLNNKFEGNLISTNGCSYKDCWLIATRPANGSSEQNYPDSLYIVRKSDGAIAPFSPTMDMEGFQQAIKNTTKL